MNKFYLYTALLLSLCTSSIAQSSFKTEHFRKLLSKEAIVLTQTKVQYNPAYISISYPMGDVPAHLGVCTDVVIRAYRKVGFDLQVGVHEDMVQHFSQYPKIWGRKSTDKNIDHRRVPNLMKYFARKGQSLSLSTNPLDYQPGDLVCWDLGAGITHIGIVINKKSRDGKRNLIVHNIGNGQVVEDCLFEYTIIGHYFFLP